MWSGSDLAIGTIHYDAAGDDNTNLNDEWIEIVNNSAASADMTGWALKDGSASHRD
jgi:micrococcal nuclease